MTFIYDRKNPKNSFLKRFVNFLHLDVIKIEGLAMKEQLKHQFSMENSIKKHQNQHLIQYVRDILHYLLFANKSQDSRRLYNSLGTRKLDVIVFGNVFVGLTRQRFLKFCPHH